MLTTVLDLLSVALNLAVCRPAVIDAARLQVTLLADEMIAWSHWLLSILYPTLLMVTAVLAGGAA